MSEQLITRYRPTTFGGVIGNRPVIRRLEALVRSAGRPHGYLFEGPSGVGKTTLARIIGAEIKAHIEEIDAASFSGVEDTRFIVRASGFSSVMIEPNRLYIFDECHALSKQAWNPLLKLIEEPPEDIYIALCTTAPECVPETIETRCHGVELGLVELTELTPWASHIAALEGWTIPHDVFMCILRAARGSPRRALNYLQAGNTARTVRELLDTVRNIRDAINVIEPEPQPDYERHKRNLENAARTRRELDAPKVPQKAPPPPKLPTALSLGAVATSLEGQATSLEGIAKILRESEPADSPRSHNPEPADKPRTRKTRHYTPESRQRISEAQKRRWAKIKEAEAAFERERNNFH
jgi:DNA polymerase III gamma/tau subunit